MPITTHYSHAAPYIRQQLIYAAHDVVAAKTIKGKEAARAARNAYAKVLSIMKDSEDQTMVDGVPNIDAYPIDGLEHVIEYFKDRLPEFMGEQGAQSIHDRLTRYQEIQTRSQREREQRQAEFEKQVSQS